MDILRFITAGSVDDGKSTLIGRLLYDSKSILADQLQAIRRQSRSRVGGEIDLALLTDGLRAEREQGITIDVAYKYFSTSKRKFIVADTPGHIQYTRNMVTGASTANMAIILIDARHGILEQTTRHAIISSLLRIPHIVVCVNKMDLVDFSEDRFYEIVRGFQAVAEKLSLKEVYYIPVCASLGDNIVKRSGNMPWFTGSPLLPFLEEVPLASDFNFLLGRFPVQVVIRPQTPEHPDYRGYAGKIISGVYRKGDRVKVLPTGWETTIQSLESSGAAVTESAVPSSIIMHLTDDLDISRGDTIVPAAQPVTVSQDIRATICWMDTQLIKPGDQFLLQHNCMVVKCVVREIPYRLDVNSLEHLPVENGVGLNDIFTGLIRTARPLVYDSYADNRANGGFILINENTHLTVGAGMIC
ncbi:MAG TPA: GTP-binding protein [Chitinophagaceae bacterium]|nr:GTP-binding protein [Chitinophagaceae bacterium]